jgi:hypothetical protein
MRDFSIFRRRPHLVDLLTPKRSGVKGYRLEAATNFDAVFTPILTADISSGYLDPNLNSAVLQAISNSRDEIRIAFDPTSFAALAGISDTQHFWLRFVPVDYAGVAGTAGPPTIVLTDAERYGHARVQIAGTAPNAATVAGSLELWLFRTRDLYVKNEAAVGGSDLYVAVQRGGPERQVSPQTVLTYEEGPQDTVLVRGAGGTVVFSAAFVNYLPR